LLTVCPGKLQDVLLGQSKGLKRGGNRPFILVEESKGSRLEKVKLLIAHRGAGGPTMRLKGQRHKKRAGKGLEGLW